MGWWKRWALLVCIAAIGVQAQDTPKAEIFTGYSYSHISSGSSGSGANLNGWNAAVTGNFNSWFGITADFSGHYGSPSSTRVTRHAFLFGPTVTFRNPSLVHPFAHALFGGVRGHRGITPPGPSASPLPQLPPVSQTSFGMALGGGLDYQVSSSVAVRIVQADYLLTRFDQSSNIVCITFPCPTTVQGTQHNIRLSFGVVWRLGSK